MTNMPTIAKGEAERISNERAVTLDSLKKPRILSQISETIAVPKGIAKPPLNSAQLAVITLNEILFDELPKHGVKTDVSYRDGFGYTQTSGILPCRKCKRFALFEDMTNDRLCKSCAEI